MSAESRLKELGLELPANVSAAAQYVPGVLHRGILRMSGQIPRVGDKVAYIGRVCDESDVNQAKLAARVCALRLLSVARDMLGSLDEVERVLELVVYVNADPTFSEPSSIADSASYLMLQVFGPAGEHARTAVCVAQLPKNAMVEVSAVFADSFKRRLV